MKNTRNGILAIITLLLLSYEKPAACASGQLSKHLPGSPSNSSASTPIIFQEHYLQGWDYLYALLLYSDIDPMYLASLFADERMPSRDLLEFSLEPRESRYLYRKHNTTRTRRNAIRYFKKHYGSFHGAYEKFGVPKSIILAIIQIETQCGQNTGNRRIFSRLARLAAAATPENLSENYQRKKQDDEGLKLSQVEGRGIWLENKFLPHLISSIHYAHQNEKHPLELRGSFAGALGIPQFLPGNVPLYGEDGNADGVIDLFTPEDAIHSVAKFLKGHGWPEGKKVSKEKKLEVVWFYNHSKSYVNTVLAMATRLDRQITVVNKKLNRRKRK